MPPLLSQWGDGDTIRVREAGKSITVRLACIDAPETAQRPYGLQSRSALSALVPAGSAVMLKVQTVDRYGRTVAELLNSSENVNQLMVGRGHAFAYRKYLRQCDGYRYLSLERQAQNAGLGVWSVGRTGITRPWDYKRSRSAGVTALVHHAGTGAKRLGHGSEPSSFWLKATPISMAIEIEKPARRFVDSSP